jgi:hypothetical protein
MRQPGIEAACFSGLQIMLALLASAGLAAPALADEINDLHVIQDTSNQAIVVQTGHGNKAGSATLPMHQAGVSDDLVLTQSGDDNAIGLTGRGLLQDGSASTDGSASNIATILQQSSGNSIGELVQTTLGTHPTTGNTLTIDQLTGGSNTSVSLEQVQGDGASPNFAIITQNGFGNWLDRLSQQTSSGEDSNRIFFAVTGSHNGIRPDTLDAAGPLAILARSVGAGSARLVQGSDLSGGAANTIELTITGDFNQYGVQELGVDNSVDETITGLGNSFAADQTGRHNQVVSGGIAGDGNDLGIHQLGDSNTASAVLDWSSSSNEVGIGQDGDSNIADARLKGDHGLVGISQSGNRHEAEIRTVGNGNVILGIQIDDGLTDSVGDTLKVSINGNDNNGLDGYASQPFTGVALAGAQVPLSLSRSLLITPDATLLLSSLTDRIVLVPGMLVQWGDDDRMDIEVGTATTSDGNLFAALQKGDGNAITAQVEGRQNQFVVVQQGDDNQAALSQSGTGNISVILQ